MADRVLPAFALALTLTTACGGASPPTPTVPAGGAETITGNERLGWDQLADDPAELAVMGWAAYVDGTRASLGDVSCSSNAVSGRFPCSGRLPPLTPGTHMLQIVSFFNDDPSVESPRSAPLQVVVRAATAPAAVRAPAWQNDLVPTADGGRLRLERLIDGLVEPTDAAFAPDGRLFVAERHGRVSVAGGQPAGFVAASRLDDVETSGTNGLLGIALDPEFERTHFVFAIYVAAGHDGRTGFRLARFREVQGQLGERAILLDGIPVSPDRAAAALRVGRDGLIYLALDDGGDPRASTDPSSLNGKLLRLNRDGTTPGDQTTPILWSGVRSPRGLAFEAATIWLADDESQASGRLTAIAIDNARPRRPVVLTTHELPGRTAGPLASPGAAILPVWRDSLLMASPEGQFIMRIPSGLRGPSESGFGERLLHRRVGPIRVVLAGPDGALYFCTDTTLGRLALPNR